MTIEGFNYQEFAQTLADQAVELVPADFSDFQRNYVINTVKNFATLCAEAISKDDKLKFNSEQAMFITQIIAEWSFHKSVDIINSGILPDYWDGVMQKLAFTIFEIAKQTISQKLPQDEVLQIVEHHVKKTYASVMKELMDRKIIDKTIFERALNQSNIDVMMQQIQEEKEPHGDEQANKGAVNLQENSKILKLASIALLLKEMPQEKSQLILNKLSQKDVQTVIQYMKMPDLEMKVDKNIAMQYLQEIKTNLPEPKHINPSKVLLRMVKILNHVPKEKVEKIISKERSGVKEFVKKAYEEDYSGISPRVASIIAQYLEESAL